jgi:hypothetical protein
MNGIEILVLVLPAIIGSLLFYFLPAGGPPPTANSEEIKKDEIDNVYIHTKKIQEKLTLLSIEAVKTEIQAATGRGDLKTQFNIINKMNMPPAEMKLKIEEVLRNTWPSNVFTVVVSSNSTGFPCCQVSITIVS